MHTCFLACFVETFKKTLPSRCAYFPVEKYASRVRKALVRTSAGRVKATNKDATKFSGKRRLSDFRGNAKRITRRNIIYRAFTRVSSENCGRGKHAKKSKSLREISRENKSRNCFSARFF